MVKNQTPFQDFIVRAIKIIDIGYAAAAYFIFAIVTVMIMNKVTGPYNAEHEEKKPLGRLLADIILRVWMIGILAYIVRNIFHIIPWPFEGVYGYQHLKNKEVAESTVFVAFVVVLDVHLQNQVTNLKKRLGIHTSAHLEMI